MGKIDFVGNQMIWSTKDDLRKTVGNLEKALIGNCDSLKCAAEAENRKNRADSIDGENRLYFFVRAKSGAARAMRNDRRSAAPALYQLSPSASSCSPSWAAPAVAGLARSIQQDAERIATFCFADHHQHQHQSLMRRRLAYTLARKSNPHRITNKIARVISY